MFSKVKSNAFTVVALLVVSFSSAQGAGLVINARAPAPQSETVVTSASVYYAARAGGITTLGSTDNVAANIQRGYQVIDTTAFSTSTNFVTVDIQSNTNFTAGAALEIVFSVNESDTVIPIQGYQTVSSADTTTIPTNCAGCSAAVYAANSRTRVSLKVSDICSAGGSTTLCDPMTAGTTLSKTIYVTVGPAALTPGTNDHSSLTINLTSKAPTNLGTSCVSGGTGLVYTESQFYFPGDGEIILDPAQFGSGTGTSGAPVGNLILLAKQGSSTVDLIDPASPAAAFSTNTIYDYVSYASVVGSAGANRNFQNDVQYAAAIYTENIAGLISQTCIVTDASGVVPRSIYGVLQSSKCFIATAAYHDGDVYPVRLLRNFRDQILLKFSLGKSFVNFYYRHSPALAEWAWDKPLVRKVALKFLTPIEVIAFLILNPLSILFLILGGISFVFGWRKLSPFFLILVCTISFAQESQTPYLDRIKKQLEAEDTQKSSSSTNYTEEQKKKLEAEDAQKPPPQSSGSYSEQQKRKLETEESATGYTEKERAKLPPQQDGSFIADVKAGRDKRNPPERPAIQDGFGFKLGINPGVEVVADDGVKAFTEVYGNKWKPDFFFHYERQLFHDENFGSFAPTLDVGFSYAGGTGLFAYAFNGTTLSRTKLSLLQYPLLVGANYRFNLMRVIRPYVGANIGVYGISEIRSDKKKTKHDFSPVYSVSAGASFLLDFLDSKSMQDSYESSSIQHVYLFVEYMYLRTIAGKVAFGRNGIYSGFLFEM